MSQPIAKHETAINFVDAPALAEEFRGFDCYDILSASELMQRVTKETLSELSDAEMNQVKYWKPKTIGEFIFNFWD